MDTHTKTKSVTRLNAAYKLTLSLYLEAKEGLGSSRKNLDLGYSTDRIIRVCTADYIVDVEKAVDRVAKRCSALEKCYIIAAFKGIEKENSWLFSVTTSEEYKAIETSARQKAGAEFISCGVHPFVLYSKPTDVR